MRTLQVPLHSFGGVQTRQKEGFTGLNGKRCVPREEGGVGFRMIHEFNLELLAKQLLHLVQYPDLLVARVLKGKYYRLISPLRIAAVDNPSYVWTSISASKKLLLLGIRSKVHSGYEINV